MLSLSYDFARMGLEGVKFHAAWGKGTGVPDLLTNGGFADQDELDLRIVYEPQRGSLQGLRVELEYIDWQVFDQPSPSDNLNQYRAIVNYFVPLLYGRRPCGFARAALGIPPTGSGLWSV